MPPRSQVLATGLLVLLGVAQAADDDPFFPKPSYFKKYFAQPVTQVELQLPVKLEDYLVDERLELSLKSYLELVMANNADISIERLSVVSSRNAITRAFGAFDPLATASFQSTRALSQSINATSGASTLNQLSQPFSMGVTQLLPTGTQYSIGFSDFKNSSNSTFATINPSYSSSLNIQFTQPLLRGRGSYLTKLPITIARSRLRGVEYNFEDQLSQSITNAELAYWAVVEARENVRVAEESLKLADTALKRAQRELELGASSPLDIFQPQQTFANSQLQLTQARFNLGLTEDALRRQIGADLSPRFRNTPIVLTEPVSAPVTSSMDREKLVETALSRRPDLKSARQSLDVDDLNIRQSTNALRPNLALTGQYATSGTGGNLYQRSDVFGGGSQVVSVIPGGITDALGQLFGFGLPTYGFGLTLSLPIKNHVAAANLSDAMVSKKLDALRVRTTEQNVRLQVLTAISNVESSKASVELAKVARDLAQKRVDAEQKKYELGIDQIFFVLAAQNDLTTAEASLVRETINYHRNQLALLRNVGTLLEERGIAVQ